MQFVGIMLASLPFGYKVVFQADHGMRQPNGVVSDSFFFKDAVGLFKLRPIAVVLFVKAGQFFVTLENALLLYDFRIQLLRFFNRKVEMGSLFAKFIAKFGVLLVFPAFFVFGVVSGLRFLRFLLQFLLASLELFRGMRDVVLRVKDDVWVDPAPEGEVIDPVVAFGVELSLSGPFFGLVLFLPPLSRSFFGGEETPVFAHLGFISEELVGDILAGDFLLFGRQVRLVFFGG